MKRKEYDNKKIGMSVPAADWRLDNHIDDYFLEPSVYLDQNIWRVFILNQWVDIKKSKLKVN